MTWHSDSRLNLGCGPSPALDWTNYDRDDYGQGMAHTGDMTDGLPYADGQFDLVVAHHSLQMVPYVSIRGVLNEIHRVLRDGGRFRVSVPDLTKAFDAYRRGDLGHFPIVDDAEPTIDGKLCAYVLWYSEARLVFTRAWLTELLTGAGFTDVRRPYLLDETRFPLAEAPGETDLDTRIGESLYMVCTK